MIANGTSNKPVKKEIYMRHKGFSNKRLKNVRIRPFSASMIKGRTCVLTHLFLIQEYSAKNSYKYFI